VNAVQTVARELGDYDLELSFLYVIQDHPYVLFDRGQEGLPLGPKGRKGVYASERGVVLTLSRHETLVTLRGPGELKHVSDGIPTPVLLRLHGASSFEDLTYLARQVVAFSSHSWRSFLPAPLPVTVHYSDLVARLLGRLQRLSRWNPDAMLGRIGKTRWFL